MDEILLSAGSLQWEGLKKGGAFPHLKRWYEFTSAVPELQALAEIYYPKRNNAAKRKVAEAIKEAKAHKETANQRHTGTVQSNRFVCRSV